jgi:hypothetical protein
MCLKFTEADVNTATPSLSNAAATWAGWAVTAVTAKFYRSQSDTPKSSNNTSRILLNKPASLGLYLYSNVIILIPFILKFVLKQAFYY